MMNSSHYYKHLHFHRNSHRFHLILKMVELQNYWKRKRDWKGPLEFTVSNMVTNAKVRSDFCLSKFYKSLEVEIPQSFWAPAPKFVLYYEDIFPKKWISAEMHSPPVFPPHLISLSPFSSNTVHIWDHKYWANWTHTLLPSYCIYNSTLMWLTAKRCQSFHICFENIF